jgi:hypothetical protein
MMGWEIRNASIHANFASDENGIDFQLRESQMGLKYRSIEGIEKEGARR